MTFSKSESGNQIRLTALTVLFVIVLVSFLSASSSAAAAASAASPSHSAAVVVVGPTTWHVFVGGQSSDMAIQGIAFYPGVITVDAGDTIVWTWNGGEPHTVSFLSGAPPPSNITQPLGGSTYNGTGIFSSGLKFHGQNYSLAFTKAGVYTYQCLLHPGMQGVVIVQPAGTPYPLTQTQYNATGMQELLADLAAGQQAVSSFHPTTVSEPNGTTVYYAAAGISPPEAANVTLAPINGSSVNGSASLSFAAPGTLKVEVNLSGLAPNTTHPAHIHLGVCGADGGIAYNLTSLVAGPTGKANSTTMVRGVFVIPGAGWFVNVHTGPTLADGGAAPIACGNVLYRSAHSVRFLPGNLTIHAGDKIIWTELAANDVHTVTFLAPGQTPPPFPSPQALMQVGNDTSYNGTSYYNSGVLLPGQSYVLTFPTPGNYTYLCILHYTIGMTGNVTVV